MLKLEPFTLVKQYRTGLPRKHFSKRREQLLTEISGTYSKAGGIIHKMKMSQTTCVIMQIMNWLFLVKESEEVDTGNGPVGHWISIVKAR